MSRAEAVNLLLHSLIFMLGAGIGSFLNVVIYRLPLGISVNNPRRSFCPSCRKQIPAYRNLPLFTWLLQRGRCAECGAPIAFRYFFVELLTGCLFYILFLKFGGPWEEMRHWGPVVLTYWIFTALLIAGTFIDLDHFILPDEITKTGLVVGLLASYAAPALMTETEQGRAMIISFVSACLGYALVKLIVEFGKLAFGRLRQQYEPAATWNITQPDANEAPIFTVAGEALSLSEIFSRPSDRLSITGDQVTVNERTFGGGRTEIKMETLRVQPTTGEAADFKLEEVTRLEGSTTEVVIPREAMGLGDVWLLAMIGAVLGWKAVLFTIVGASFLGSMFAVIPRLIGKTKWTEKIPFGPYLAAAAMIWLLLSVWDGSRVNPPDFVQWYWDRINWREPAL